MTREVLRFPSSPFFASIRLVSSDASSCRLVSKSKVKRGLTSKCCAATNIKTEVSLSKLNQALFHFDSVSNASSPDCE